VSTSPVTAHPEIRQFGDPVLRTRCTPVSSFDDRLRASADRMFRVMAEAEGMGLAANQVGLTGAFFVWAYEGERGLVANPRLEIVDAAEVTEPEGCLSVFGYSWPTPRAQVVRVSGRDGWGEPVDIQAEGYLARCFQHECDHLDGRLYLQRLSGRLRRQALDALR
jgi:peptide deformylase